MLSLSKRPFGSWSDPVVLAGHDFLPKAPTLGFYQISGSCYQGYDQIYYLAFTFDTSKDVYYKGTNPAGAI
jgi:hypothetical protein